MSRSNTSTREPASELPQLETTRCEEDAAPDGSPNNHTNGIDTDDAASAATSTSERTGTMASALFNILSTMVGGGSLSLPMAFLKTGNALLGPLLLIVVACITEFCFRMLITSARTLSPVTADHTIPGKDSYEAIAAAAFGNKAYLVSTMLVTAMCFFGTVAYAVLLRDMLQPISEVVFGHHRDDESTLAFWFTNNAVMFSVVLLVTPLCTLRTLTALKRFGALSMFSVLILGSCIVYRSIQCNVGYSHGTDDDSDHSDDHHDNHFDWWKAFRLWPDNAKDVLDVFPIFVSCYVCHYNIPTVHNELRNPSLPRVNGWLRSTTWIATAFYLIMGIAGSAYSQCTPTGTLHGNVLLDFSNSDPLLLVGRMCLAFTITMAFPMLTIPARDIFIRSVLPTFQRCCKTGWWSGITGITSSSTTTITTDLVEPLLETTTTTIGTSTTIMTDAENGHDITAQADGIWTPDQPISFMVRLVSAIIMFWTAAAVASCVASIDIVWDLLGSSLSILLSYLIPAGAYLVITRVNRAFGGGGSGVGSGGVLEEEGETPIGSTSARLKEKCSNILAWTLIVVFVPLMILSTANAVYDTFFLHPTGEDPHHAFS